MCKYVVIFLDLWRLFGAKKTKAMALLCLNGPFVFWTCSIVNRLVLYKKKRLDVNMLAESKGKG